MSFPPLRVLHESRHVLVIDKPPGVPFHQPPGGVQPGLLQLCRSQQAQALLPEGPLFPVHRLDTLTSGALVLARDRQSAGLLARDFRHRRVHKYYVALSERRPSKKMGSVVGDMQRGRRGSWLLARSRGDPAVTRFASTAVPGRRPGLRAFLLKPETGRTHQLRVALKSLGAPALGDARYAQADSARREDRMYLHCAALRFATLGGPVQVVCRPVEGLEFQAPGFQSVFDEWLPTGLVTQAGPWFPESKLLCSSMATITGEEEGAGSLLELAE